jgi:membrane associated rhomboid family serine protease
LIPLKDNIPTRRFPVLTVAIIVINVLMFFGFQHAHWDGKGFAVDETKTVEYSFIPYELTHVGKNCGLRARVEPANETVTSSQEALCEGQTETFTNTQTGETLTERVVKAFPTDQPPWWATIFFAMFMHGGLLHIAGNMLFLWIFGNNIEDAMSRWRFGAFYLLGGIAAALGQWLVHTSSTTPTLGASGAIAAVLGGYALLYPRARVVTVIFIIFFFTIVELPALFVLGGWFLLQVVDGVMLSNASGGGVAYYAHIGGFLFGLAAIRLFANRVHYDYVQPRLPVY